MALQPYNSKFTIELLQDFQIYPSNELLQNQNSNLEHTSSLQERGNQINSIQIPISEKRAIYQHHNHSTKHKTTLVKDWVTGEQVGGGRKKAIPWLFYKMPCS